MAVDEIKIIVRAEVDAAMAKLHSLEKTNMGVNSSFAKMRDVMQGPVAAAKMVVQAIGQVVEIGKELYGEFADAEKATIQLNAALQNNALMTSGAEGRLSAFADGLQQVSIFEGDNTKSIIANLAAMGKSEDQIKDLITAASNMASATGDTLDGAVTKLNMTLQGSAGRMGLQNAAIKDLTEEELKAGRAIEIVNKQYAGMAEALGKSALGAAERLQNNVGDLKESLGEIVAYKFGPLIENMVNAAKEAADKISSGTNLMKVIAGDDESIEALRKAMITIQDEINNLNEASFTTYTQYKNEKKALEEGYEVIKKKHSAALAIANAEEKSRDIAAKQAAAIAAAAAAEKKTKDAMIAKAQQAIDEDNIILANYYLKNERAKKYLKTEDDINKKLAEIAGRMKALSDTDVEASEGFKDFNTFIEEFKVSLSDIDAAIREIPPFSPLDEEAIAQFQKLDEFDVWLEKWKKEKDELAPEPEAWDEYIGKLTEAAEKQDAMVQIATAVQDAWANALTELGAGLVDGSASFADFGNAAIDALAQVLKGFGAQLAAMAAIELIKLNFAGAAAAGAGSAAAYVAAGALSAVELADGGIVKSKPGGTLALIGEAGRDEAVVPLNKGGSGIGGTTINVYGNIWQTRELEALAISANRKMARAY